MFTMLLAGKRRNGMRRRDILRTGGAAVAICPFPKALVAQTKVSKAAVRPAISSTNLHWVRDPQDLAHTAVEMGFGAVTTSIGPSPAHIPLGDEKLLRSHVAKLRSAGLTVDTAQLSVPPDGAGFAAFLQSCEGLEIRRFVFGPFPYTVEQPLAVQRAKYKKQLAVLAKACAERNVRALYRNRAGSYLGAILSDVVTLLGDLDPKGIGICYDTGQGALAGGNGSWAVELRIADQQVGCVLCTDASLHFQLDTDEGGAFGGSPSDLAVTYGQRKTPAPLGGGGGQTNPWVAPSVPLGTGLVDLPQLGLVLKDIGFNGPLVVESDYPNGGAENGGDKLTLPRAMVLGAMKRDLLTLKAGLGPSGLI